MKTWRQYGCRSGCARVAKVSLEGRENEEGERQGRVEGGCERQSVRRDATYPHGGLVTCLGKHGEMSRMTVSHYDNTW